MVGLVSLWMLIQLVLLSGFAHDRSQTLLYDRFRTELAAATAPIGPAVEMDAATGESTGEVHQIEPGSPVALLTIPRLGVDEVVVEGTAPGDTLAGPGHQRNTVLPGQAGTAVVIGRGATYGAPFGELDQLRVGDVINVVMGQGETAFTVTGLRRAGDPLPQPRAEGAARLILATGAGEGRLARLTPGDVLYVDADAPKGFIPPPGLSGAVPEAEQVMGQDPGALPLLTLHLALLLALTLCVVAARQRWSATLVWVVAAPLGLALSWATTDVVMRLLPNVI